MALRFRFPIVPLVALFLPAVSVAPAWAEPRIEPGLWEITLGGDMTGMMAEHMKSLEKELAGMPPEMQAQMKAMLAQQMQGLSEPQQQCITPEDVRKGFSKMLEEQGGGPGGDGCSQKVEWQGSIGALSMRCQDGAHGDGRINVVSPKQIETEMRFVDPQDSPMNMSWRGRWLKADCGDVR